MAIVKVIQNHHSGGKMYKVGEEREVSDSIAAELKRNGLVETDIQAAPPEKTENIIVSDKKVIKNPSTKK